jgi:hypothetical protein
MKKYIFRATFELGSIRPNDVIENIDEFLDFIPGWVISTSLFEDGDFFDTNKLRAIKDSGETMFELSDAELYSKSFQYTTLDLQKIVTLTWSSDDIMDSIPNDKILKFIVSSKGFVCAQKFEYYDAYWQSEIFEANYIAQNKSTVGLKYANNEYLGKVIDISKNYGRDVLTKGGLWLIAAPEMWFGKVFYSFINADRLKGFPNAKEIKELDYNCLYIKLFNYNESPSELINREKQRKFREWIDMDKLEKTP